MSESLLDMGKKRLLLCSWQLKITVGEIPIYSSIVCDILVVMNSLDLEDKCLSLVYLMLFNVQFFCHCWKRLHFLTRRLLAKLSFVEVHVLYQYWFNFCTWKHENIWFFITHTVYFPVIICLKLPLGSYQEHGKSVHMAAISS